MKRVSEKHIMLYFLTLIFLCVFVIATSPDEAMADGLYDYTIDSTGTYEYMHREDGTVTIVDIIKQSKEVVFPTELDGETVTELHFWNKYILWCRKDYNPVHCKQYL